MNDPGLSAKSLDSEASSSISASLLARVKRSDPEAWRRLCKVYGPLVYRWLRQAGLQDDDAADVGQEVFRTVAARVAEFRRERPSDTFRGWLWTITRNKLGDFFRRRAAQPQAEGGTGAYQRLLSVPELWANELDASADCPEDAAVVHRLVEAIRDEFEPTTWQAFWRAAVEGQAVAVIAADLGISPHAVRQAKYRVLRRLRHELDSEH